MRALIISPTGSGVKNVVTSVASTNVWEDVDSTHLTLPIHDMAYDCTQISILNERVLGILSSSSQLLYLLYGILYFWLRAYLYVWLYRDEFDVIWIHNPRLLIFLPSSVTDQTVVTYHGPLQSDRASSKVFPASLYHTVIGWVEWLGIQRHQTAFYTAVSQGIIDSVQAYGISPKQTTFIGNGVDVERFSPGKPDPNRITWERSAGETILYVGRLASEKGVIMLINSFEELLERVDTNRLQLVIVGDGPLHSAVETRSKDVEGVCCVGYIDHSDVVHAYRSSDYLALPSKFEGASIPLSLSEGLACGLPVFASTIPTLRDISEEEFVIPVEFETPEKGASQMHDLISKGERRDLLSNIARAYAQEHLTWEARADQYLDKLRSQQDRC